MDKKVSSQLKLTNKKIYIILLLSVVITVLLSLTLLKSHFLVRDSETQITIVDTATRNPKSWGTDVRIQRIKIDGKEIPFSDLEFDENWVRLDDLLVAINPQQPVSVSLMAENAEEIEIHLQKHDGSGVVEIREGNRKIGELDLYSEKWENITFNKRLGKVSYTDNWLFLLSVFLLVGSSLLIIKLAVSQVLQQERVSKFVKELILCYGVLLIAGLYFDKIKDAIIFVAVSVILATIFIGISDFIKKDSKAVILLDFVLLLLSATILCYVVERINGNHENLSLIYFAGNILVYLSILLLFFIFIRRTVGTVMFGSTIIYMFAVANYYVTLFRGSPIVPGDFYTIGTAANIVQNYHYEINWNLFLATWILVIWFVMVRFVMSGIKKTSKKQIVLSAISLVAIVFVIGSTEFYRPSLDFWNLNSNVKKYGIAMSLISNVRRMKIEPPEGYSQEQLKNLCEEYKNYEKVEGKFTPNVIAIMNESFADLSILSDTIDSNSYMPYYNSLEENVAKGFTMVSTIGGGTGNTEYEFLTGNSMAFLPGTVPYQQFVIKESFSMAQYFKELGYGTVAIHPYDKTGYNRQRAYPYLGFDSFLDIDAFVEPQLSRQRYVTDEESYKKVIEEFENARKNNYPAFIFNVTMQNHSDYATGFYGEDRIKIPGYEGKFPNVEEYLTLIKESDDALKGLIDYFSVVNEPTVIVMFGDHQPQIETAFYEEMLGKPLNEWTLEEVQKRYMVPFFIWTNFDSKEQNNMITSVNYLSSILFDQAGITMTPYQEFLLSLQQTIPAMNMNGYLESHEGWHEYSGKNSEAALMLKQYEYIQYNNVFAKEKISQWFSGKPDTNQ